MGFVKAVQQSRFKAVQQCNACLVPSSPPVSLFDLKARFFIPTRSSARPSRAGAVKVGRRTGLSTCFALARPYLDSFEHDGTLGAVGMTIRGEPAFGAADQSRHNLVFGRSEDPNHDAAMRIGSEAPRRRTHSSSRHDSHESPRDTATSNRHRRPVTSGTEPKLSGVFSDLRSLRRTQYDAVRQHALPHQPPQGDQKLAR
jgi:hypothetical protein